MVDFYGLSILIKMEQHFPRVEDPLGVQCFFDGLKKSHLDGTFESTQISGLHSPNAMLGRDGPL